MFYEQIGDDNKDVIIRKTNNQLVKISQEQLDDLLKTKCCISANNVLFLKSEVKLGIIPSFLGKLYEGRVAIKNEMKTNKKIAHEIDEQIKELEEQLKNCKE